MEIVLSDNEIPRAPPRTDLGYPQAISTAPVKAILADHVLKWVSNEQPPFQKLSVAQCIAAYATEESHRYGDVLLVSHAKSVDYEDHFLFGTFDGISTSNATMIASPDGSALTPTFDNINDNAGLVPWSWMCAFGTAGTQAYSEGCPIDEIAPNGRWVYGNTTVEYCLSRVYPPACELDFSLQIALAVLICNLGKIIAMCLAFHGFQRRKPLLTTGDCIASFLEKSDPVTKHSRLISQWAIDRPILRVGRWKQEHITDSGLGVMRDVVRWKPLRRPWASKADRSYCLVLPM